MGNDFKNLRDRLAQEAKQGGDHKPKISLPPHGTSHFAGGHRDEPKKPQPSRRQEDGEGYDVDFEALLKRFSVIAGILVAIISIYFSYDGFDNSVTGGNENYTTLAKVIGVTLAVTVTLVQFVFSSSFNKLNMTLKFFGILSYVYSMWSNYNGINHILQMEQFPAYALTLAMDGLPEPLIAWALGASLRGDFIGNLTKMLFGGASHKSPRKYESSIRDEFIDRLGK